MVTLSCTARKLCGHQKQAGVHLHVVLFTGHFPVDPGEARADGQHGPAGPLACGVAHHHIEIEGELLVILKVERSCQCSNGERNTRNGGVLTW